MSRIITIFRSRLNPDAQAAYMPVTECMTKLAQTMPGYIDAKTFSAVDGERVTIVTFADRASHNAWRDHPEHRSAQVRGRQEFYQSYSIQVGEETYCNEFKQ